MTYGFSFSILIPHAASSLLGDEIDSKQFLGIFDRKYELEEGFRGKSIGKWPPSTELHEFYCERDIKITSRKSDIVLIARRRVKNGLDLSYASKKEGIIG